MHYSITVYFVKISSNTKIENKLGENNSFVESGKKRQVLNCHTMSAHFLPIFSRENFLRKFRDSSNVEKSVTLEL